MDAVKGMMTTEAVDKAATQAGESPDGMKRAMQGAIPTVFAGLTQGAAAPGGATRIFAMLTGGGESGQGLMSAVFGQRGAAVTDALGASSGVKSQTASHALSFALPMIMGAIGKHVLANRMTPGGMSQMLSGHKKAIQDDPSTPPGLAGALGLGSLGALGGQPAQVEEPRVSGAEVTPSPQPERAPAVEALQRRFEAGPPRRSRMGLALLAGIVAALLAVVIGSAVRRNGPTGVTAPQPTAPTLHAPEIPKVAPPNVAAGPITLPGGKTLDVAPGSAQAQMAHALGDASTPLPHAYAFDEITFDRGSVAIGPDGVKGIDTLATMLQAYPSARVRVMGHADGTGTAAVNEALAEKRAREIKDALVARGVSADRIETAGEGARRPVPGTEPESAANRRAVVVLLQR
jgi:outer membrane protein OmpA-like peptidoglycan-associated protein